MAYRILEVTLASAKDLKDVNVFSKMDVYAVATLSGDPRTKQRTPTDNNGGKDPSWNATLRFSIPADNAAAAGLVLHVLLRSERALGDRDIGEVHVPVKELIEGTPGRLVSYQVRNPQSGKAKGVLNLSFKFGQMPAAEKAPKPAPAADPFTAYPPPSKGSAEPVTAYPPPSKGSADPVTAYPAATSASATPYPPPGYAPPAGYGYGYPPPPQGGYGYPPPPQAGYSYPPPQQGGYGYPPPQAGYGYPPQMAQPGKKKNKFGMGLGAGLLGGALGGLLIGDMVSDADAYDAGYDDGFGDGMDF